MLAFILLFAASFLIGFANFVCKDGPLFNGKFRIFTLGNIYVCHSLTVMLYQQDKDKCLCKFAGMIRKSNQIY